QRFLKENYRKNLALKFIRINNVTYLFRLIEGVDEVKFATLSKNDLNIILDFFVQNENNKLKPWKG
ncbi:MAG: hypothetical protein ACI85O_001157, partial [Saprospiraceae bacterium]